MIQSDAVSRSMQAEKLTLPVLGKFGSTMSIVKTDIGGSIMRLETEYASYPTK